MEWLHGTKPETLNDLAGNPAFTEWINRRIEEIIFIRQIDSFRTGGH